MMKHATCLPYDDEACGLLTLRIDSITFGGTSDTMAPIRILMPKTTCCIIIYKPKFISKQKACNASRGWKAQHPQCLHYEMHDRNTDRMENSQETRAKPSLS